MFFQTSLAIQVVWLLAPLAGGASCTVASCLEGPSMPIQVERKPDLDETARLLVEGTNAFRKREHLAELKENVQLAGTAHDFAAFMARTDKYGHDADGNQPADRVKNHGYEYCIVAENIAYEFNSAGFTTDALARGLLDGWKKSPGHRKNMLLPEVMEAGMAVAHSEESDKYYAVQVLARPRSAAFSFEIANESGTKIEYQFGDEAFTLEERYTRTHEVCVPAALKFTWKESEGKAETFQPGKGDRFVVTRTQGKFQVKRQEPAKRESDRTSRKLPGS